MAEYENPTGDVVGTPENDTFAFTVPLAQNPQLGTLTGVDALGGTDSLLFDVDYLQGVTFKATDFNGVFNGQVQTGPSDPTLLYYNFENLEFVGTAYADRVELKIASGVAALTAGFDAGAGNDRLVYDFSEVSAGQNFVLADGTITSTYGQFAGFESFEIMAGSGSDFIQTGDGDDSVVSSHEIFRGSNFDTVWTGGGNDTIRALTLGHYDGGEGFDTWVGDFAELPGMPASPPMGFYLRPDRIEAAGLNVTNVESVTISTGSDYNRFDVTGAGPAVIYAGSGWDDELYVAMDLAGPQTFVAYADDSGSFFGTANALSFNDLEQLSFTGGASDDSFSVAGVFNQFQVTFDGGAGSDLLQGDFSQRTVPVNFWVNPDGTLIQELGTFTSFERFALTGGSSHDWFITQAGNDSLSGGSGGDLLESGGGDDTVFGGAGQDLIHAGAGNDTVHGEADNDVIYGEDGNDTITGAAGADSLDGGNDNDSLDGGDGDDSLYGGGGNDKLTGGAGIDSLYGGDGNDRLYSHTRLFGPNEVFDPAWYPKESTDIYGERDSLYGDAGDDEFFVGFGDSVYGETENSADRLSINLLGATAGVIADFRPLASGSPVTVGFATITGIESVDYIEGSNFDDFLASYHAPSPNWDLRIWGHGGNDSILITGSGGIFGPSVWGGEGNDFIDASSISAGGSYYGEAGDDTLIGSGGADTMLGGSGDDRYYVDNALDEVTEGIAEGANDHALASVSYVLGAGAYVEKLTTTNDAGTAAINLTGNAFAQRIVGNAGANVLDGRGGADTMVGLGGDDWYYVDNAAAVVIEGAAEGTADRIFASVSYTLGTGVHVEKLTTSSNTATTAINLAGNELANQIYGNAGANVLDGKGGADTLIGLGGNDWYYVDNAGDVVTEGAAEGTADRILASVSYVMGAGVYVEQLTTNDDAGTAAINLTGNAFVQSITGNAGANVLDGGGGIDTMTGLGGDDWYYVDNIGDAVVEGAGQGVADRIFASVSYVMGAGVHVEQLTTANDAGTAAINLTGNAFAQQIVGNAGANVLDGRGGADTMVGLGGDDWYYVDNAAAVVTEGAAEGTADRIFASVSYTLGTGVYVEKLTTSSNTATTAINLTGNELANQIYGNAGANVLDGKGGADALIGLGGNDWYYVDNAGDVVTEGATEGTADRILASVSFTLGAGVYVEQLTTANDAGTAAINLTGNAFVQSITGNAGANVLDGAGGIDTMIGLGGDDWFYVDNVGDAVVEGAGQGVADRIFASVSYVMGAGVQVEQLTTANDAGTAAINLTGNALAQQIVGNAGANVLDGRGGADTLVGLGGDDWYYVDNAAAVVTEGAAEGTADRIFASVSYTLGTGVYVEKLTTSSNTATTAINLTGNELANQIYGNAGANALDGKGGADTLVGLGGNDWYYVDNALDVVTEGAAEGANDQVLASVSYILGVNAYVEKLTTTDDAGTAAIDLAGNAFAQTIVGNAGSNLLAGADGADTLVGLGGNDRLDGGFGNDAMTGGLGDDTFTVHDAGDQVFEAAGEGYDMVVAFASWTLAAGQHVERIVLGEVPGAVELTGNELDNQLAGNAAANVLTGGAGNDVLEGGAGGDTMRGGTGNDIYFVDSAGDTVIELNGEGTDELLTSVSYTLGATQSIETLQFTDLASTVAAELRGNGGANTIYGNAGANLLDGGGGADTLTGLGGDDWYYVDNVGDVVVEVAGGGAADRIFAGVSYVMGAAVHVEKLTTTSNTATTAIDLTGNELANQIYGNAGANVLDGKGGADTLFGLAGADTFAFTTALGGGNVDAIGDFVVADDTIQLENAVFTGLAAGILAAGAFNTGAAATQADDRIIYNSATGALLFDADGFGGAAAVQFATLGTGLALTSADFLVI